MQYESQVLLTSDDIIIEVNGQTFVKKLEHIPNKLSRLIIDLKECAKNNIPAFIDEIDLELLEESDIPMIVSLVKKYTNGRVTSNNVGMYLDGALISDNIVNNIIDIIKTKDVESFQTYISFQESLIKNPEVKIIDRLHKFVSCNSLYIDNDGYIYAYKAVRDNLLDKYSGTYKHDIGAIISMPRNQVDANENRTCSYGLHVCSIKYLHRCYYDSSDKIVIVKVKPEDFVSIPVDYNNTKARVCSYEVVEILDDEKTEELMNFSYNNEDTQEFLKNQVVNLKEKSY